MHLFFLADLVLQKTFALLLLMVMNAILTMTLKKPFEV